nr:MAG TPA: hypothetical protein [Caudoviricetes sp.]
MQPGITSTLLHNIIHQLGGRLYIFNYIISASFVY